MNNNNNLEKTRQEFEKSFGEERFYIKQTADENHLDLLLGLIAPQEREVIVDLGTGAGYIAFPLAEKNPECQIIGLDILIDTLVDNDNKAKEKSIHNLKFLTYDGKSLPFEDSTVDTIVTRYALHHFTDLQSSLQEMHRVLKKGGKLVISDPTPNCYDDIGFVDEFMKVRPDGHVKFYTFSEFDKMLIKAGFGLSSCIYSAIRFPRKNPEEYEAVLSKYRKTVWECYGIEIIDDEIWISEDVLNMVYYK